MPPLLKMCHSKYVASKRQMRRCVSDERPKIDLSFCPDRKAQHAKNACIVQYSIARLVSPQGDHWPHSTLYLRLRAKDVKL